MTRIWRLTRTSSLAMGLVVPVLISGGVAPTLAATGSWKAQNSGTTRALFDVACPTAARCYAVGSAGIIRTTANGGLTWKAQPNPLAGSSTALVRIACPAAASCYAVGAPNTVLVTHNGGDTWKAHTFALGVSVALSAVACLDTSTCYLVGGPTTAWLITHPIVFLTTNGGAAWRKQAVPPTVPCLGDCGQPNVGYPLDWVTCLPNHLCRAGGVAFMDSHSGFTGATLLTLAPGGPWQLLASGTTPSLATCPSVSRCYAVQTVNPFARPIKVWVSADGGVSWLGRDTPTNRVLNGIACPGAVQCYAVGNTGTILHTLNGRTLFAEHSPNSRDLYGIACVTARKCIAVGNKGVIVART
jgi:photosystem II stability/assembly factor-like uncharacterized protein